MLESSEASIGPSGREEVCSRPVVARIHDLKMTWQDMEGSDRENTVIMVACGPVEQHGPQTPLGTDLYIAEYVMHECAENLADHGYTVVAPTVPYVNALFSLPYLGSVSIRRKVVEEYLFDLRNDTLRQRLSRFVRKSLSFSKSDRMHEICLRLFLHRYNIFYLP